VFTPHLGLEGYVLAMLQVYDNSFTGNLFTISLVQLLSQIKKKTKTNIDSIKKSPKISTRFFVQALYFHHQSK
jgi:hypothetical protein